MSVVDTEPGGRSENSRRAAVRICSRRSSCSSRVQRGAAAIPAAQYRGCWRSANKPDVPMGDPPSGIRGITHTLVIVHHVHLRPTFDGSRIVDVTMDLTAAQLDAGAHAVRHVTAERYRVTA